MTKRHFLSVSTIVNSVVASVDQATLSGLSFLISIILIKNVSKVEYGYYSIAFTITLFLICVQNAIVNSPLAVLLVSKKGSESKNYPASLFYGQFIVFVPIVCLILTAAALFTYFGFHSPHTSLAAALSFASVGILLREFLRAYFFAEEMPQQVLKMDVLYVLLFLTGLYTLHLLLSIRVSSVFILMGISGILAGIIFCRGRNWHYREVSIKKSYRENWKYGKWALLGVIIWHIQNYSYLYLLGALLGSVAVADVSAARLLMMPMILFREGWMKIAIPHGSRLREQRQLDRFVKEQVFICLIFAIIVVLYTAAITNFSEVLQTVLFTQKYSGSLSYIIFFAVIFIIGFFGVNANYGLQVTKNFDLITKVSFFTMLVTLGCAYFLIKAYGIKGGLTALIIGEVLVSGILWFYYAKIVFYDLVSHRYMTQKKVLIPKISRSETFTMTEE